VSAVWPSPKRSWIILEFHGSLAIKLSNAFQISPGALALEIP
jgi:hypothetical protein